jgi:poly-gamma-glutamate synthesis protein (capsule biosynthesis protein)
MLETDFSHNGFSFVATGDSLIFQKISIFDEPGFLRVRGIVKKADAAFNNFETIIPTKEHYARYKIDTAAWMRSPRYVLEELLWMGFTVFSLANNHSMDYSEGGLLETKRIFNEMGITNAGTGRNLSEAREPAYINTPRGRVALIACNTRDEDGPAGMAWKNIPGRPGLNPVRSRTLIYLKESEFKKLAGIAESLDLPGPQDGNLNFMGSIFKLGERTDIHTEPYKPDVDGNTYEISKAKDNADLVYLSIHNHDKRRPGLAYFDDKLDYIANFVETFSREAIDAGADAVLGHGTHRLNGIEIYRGKPIFYGLGNFIAQRYHSNPKPYEWFEARGLGDNIYPDEPSGYLGMQLTEAEMERNTWRSSTSVVANIKYVDYETQEIDLYPIVIKREGKQGGRPFVATGDDAHKILTRLARLSYDYGTKIMIENGVGKIKL